MIFEHKSYRSFLKTVLVERVASDSAYSLRAMARGLGFSSSQLSEVMSGKANFSSAALRRIAKKLEFGPEETECLCLLGELENEKDPEIRESLILRLQRLNPEKRSIHDLTVDHFRQISEWYHSVILELVYLPKFEFTPDNIGKRLGISKAQVELALERLLRLELLQKDDRGHFIRPAQDVVFRSPERNAAMRGFYRQMMGKASEALEEQTPEERCSGYETLPFASEAMPEIKQAIEEFFENIIRISKKHPKKKNVYHLLIHFFNVTPDEGRENNCGRFGGHAKELKS